MKPVVTIGLCVKNNEKTVREAVDSIVDQDFCHDLLEVIVVDGCSLDLTLAIIRDALKNLAPVSHTDMKVIDALRHYVNSEDKSDKLAMFVRLIDSKANAHKLLVSQGKLREAQNVHSEWKALVEVANLLGIESELEMIKKEE